MKTLWLLLLGAALLGCHKSPDLTDLRRELIATQVAFDGIDLKRGLWQAPDLHRQTEQLVIAARLHAHELTPRQSKDVEFAISAAQLAISAGLLYTRDGSVTYRNIAQSHLDGARTLLRSGVRTLEPKP